MSRIIARRFEVQHSYDDTWLSKHRRGEYHAAAFPSGSNERRSSGVTRLEVAVSWKWNRCLQVRRRWSAAASWNAPASVARQPVIHLPEAIAHSACLAHTPTFLYFRGRCHLWWSFVTKQYGVHRPSVGAGVAVYAATPCKCFHIRRSYTDFLVCTSTQKLYIVTNWFVQLRNQICAVKMLTIVSIEAWVSVPNAALHWTFTYLHLLY